MAKMYLPIPAIARRNIPYWSSRLSRKVLYEQYNDPESVFQVTDMGVLKLNSGPGSTYELTLATGLPTDNFEVLIKSRRLINQTESYINHNEFIMISADDNTHTEKGYYIALNKTSAGINIYNRDGSGGFKLLNNANGGHGVSLQNDIYIRVRREGNSLKVRTWSANASEPAVWHLDITTSIHNCHIVKYGWGGYGFGAILRECAIATEGDSATFDVEPVTTIRGSFFAPYRRFYAIAKSAIDHEVLATGLSDRLTGDYTLNIYSDEPYYIVYETTDTRQELSFALQGESFLGGQYPDSSIKAEGTPSDADVFVKIKDRSSLFDGHTVAKLHSDVSGEWKISGLSDDMVFDVVGRKEGFNDVIVSGVTAELDPNPPMRVSTYYGIDNNGVFKLISNVSNATPPLSVDFAGSVPRGLGQDHVTIDDGEITIEFPVREISPIDFDIIVTDDDGKSVSSQVTMNDVVRADFVEVVNVVPNVTSSGMNDMVLTIPQDVEVGDLLVLCIRQRMDVSVSDDSGGSWTLQEMMHPDVIGSSYAQGLSIYHREALEGDSGEAIRVSKGTIYGSSTDADASLIVLRGLYSGIEVVSSGNSGVDIYDERTNTSHVLTPIEHDSSYLLRYNNWVYASNATTCTYDKLTERLPTTYAENNNAQVRSQVGTLMLRKPDILRDRLSGLTGNSNDILLDAWLIIDEKQ